MAKIGSRIFNHPDIGSYFNRGAATVLDNTSTTLPNPNTDLIDGVKLEERDTVLFTNLTDNDLNNKVYIVKDIGADTFRLQVIPSLKHPNGDAQEGDLIVIKSGSNPQSLYTFESNSWQQIDIDTDDLNDLKVDGSTSPNADIDWDGNKIVNLGDPTSDQDAVTKIYVDNEISGLSQDHGDLTGLADDDHTQYHNDTRGDIRYYIKTQYLNSSTGVSDAGKPVVLDAGGQIDSTMINPADINHDQLLNFVFNEHIDWTANGAGTIDPSNYVDNDTTDHTALSNIGTNSHAQIDTHISDATLHFTEASIDHGTIAGLADDDHTQYVLADGTRDITGAIVIDGAKFSQSSSIGNKCLFIGENPVSATGNDSTGIGIGSLLSLTNGPGNTAIGVNAGYSITTGSFNILVGQNAGSLGLSNGFGNVGVGAGALQQAGANSQKLVAIGNVSGLQATGSRALYIGAAAGFQCTGSNNIVLTGEGNAGDFRGLTSLAASNEFSVGSALSPIIDAYFGEGAVSASPGNISFNGTGGNGTDISAGAFVDLNGGRGTGTGQGSAVRIRTAPAGATGSTRNALVTRMEIADTGKVDFSSAAPVGLPRLTTTERDALTAVNGDVIYNTTDNKFQGYESGAWVNLI